MSALAKLTALACSTTLLLAPALAHANELAPPPEPASTAAPATPEAPPAAEPVEPPAPAMVSDGCVDDSLSMTGNNLWTGLEGARVKLSLRNENQVEGTIVAQDRNKLAVARSSDGSVVSVPKQEVAGVKLVTLAPGEASSTTSEGELPPIDARPRDDGRKLYGAGVGLLAFGVPLGVAGTAMFGLFLGAAYIWAPILLPGVGMIVGGSIAMKRSHQRLEAYRRAWGLPPAAKLRVTPSFAAGRNGGQVGLVMRF